MTARRKKSPSPRPASPPDPDAWVRRVLRADGAAATPATVRRLAREVLEHRDLLRVLGPLVAALVEARRKQRAAERRVGVLDPDYHARVTLATLETQRVERGIADALLEVSP